MSSKKMNYDKLIEFLEKKDTFSHYSQIKITKLEEGYVEAQADMSNGICQNYFNGLHGGYMATMTDLLAGTAALSYGKVSMTLQSNLNCIHSVSSGIIRGVGKVIHHGRTTAVVDVYLYGDQEKLICKATYTMFIKDIPLVLE